ncbi:hypothetical protein RclHR1_05350002 [Rhizophagus clarus]|uniref:Restriction endonuclease domain-containing protein n=1 Tax=Rhizophagus clarus TaxID=94130 RepID=A0A2Z6RLN7_9GLOM|nr:hypothetical protein RclHR1_05350002 [Rhizophagus clarus]GES90438.1 hypothetical protein GLOIN_2v1768213 [Rhizophagus clarus]
MTKFRIKREVLNSAEERLLTFQQREDTGVLATEAEEEEVSEEEEEENELESGIVIARNISLKNYLDYRNGETRFTVDTRLLDGKVIIYEAPLSIHGAVAGEFTTRMRFWHNNLVACGERDVIIGVRSVSRPDGSIQPDDLPKPAPGRGCDLDDWPYPTVVIEVGVSEGLASLHSLTSRYFSMRTTIRIYLAVKIFGRRRDVTRAMVAFLYQRLNQGLPILPIVIKSFGTAPLHHNTVKFFRNRNIPDRAITGFGRNAAPPCNGPNIPDYQINIPAAEIFRGSPTGVPPNLVAGFNLDLYWLQRVALLYN